MDVVEIPETKHSYRVVMSGSGLRLEKIGHDETSIKTCKVTGKTTLRGGLMQINLHDGRNILAKKDTFKIGDSVVISLPDQAITSHMKLEKGAEAFITTGRNRGVWGKIKEIKERQHMLEKPVVTLDTGKKEIITPKGYIFIASREARASKETGSDKK
jgi:small subunit ribosomal protein S4e